MLIVLPLGQLQLTTRHSTLQYLISVTYCHTQSNIHMGRPKHPVCGPPPINRPPSKGKTFTSKMKGSDARDPRGDNPSTHDALPGSSIGGCARDLNARTLYVGGIDVLVGHARDHNATGSNATGSNSVHEHVAGCGNATVGHALGGNSASKHIAGGGNTLGRIASGSDTSGRNSGGGHIAGRMAMVVKGMVSVRKTMAANCRYCVILRRLDSLVAWHAAFKHTRAVEPPHMQGGDSRAGRTRPTNLSGRWDEDPTGGKATATTISYKGDRGLKAGNAMAVNMSSRRGRYSIAGNVIYASEADRWGRDSDGVDNTYAFASSRDARDRHMLVQDVTIEEWSLRVSSLRPCFYMRGE
ncbi:hypothetical protein HETIRDRAFT_424546 [Heterobasidion irregulare TC 32-1]|uniref:Uncharacterized protein n=1 Tax=Heterobasidion irregulare (strain TC 32-1) TaxID=747525 RepID=W4KIG7_HETIT|nr:uncharacterized protein HETIRDRAFT_424546 [Heterobasidion irregulare TC 32-1]ETW85110.1 hypothetical protein HETIRDRAFT_424546 [Heterobasidion irregulare TC 32-1]